MDIDTLKHKALAARTVVEQVGEASFTLRIPTELDGLLAVRRLGLQEISKDAAAMLLLQRSLLEDAITGWTGLLVAHVLPGDAAAAEHLAWHRDAVPLVLDAQPKWASALAEALLAHLSRRRQAVEADAKN